MILEIYRGNGLTELVNTEGNNEHAVGMEKPYPVDQPGSGNVDVPDANSRERGKIKGYYRGRSGITVLFDHLLCGRRKK